MVWRVTDIAAVVGGKKGYGGVSGRTKIRRDRRGNNKLTEFALGRQSMRCLAEMLGKLWNEACAQELLSLM